MRLVAGHGGDGHVGHEADAAERFAAEPERPDRLQILVLLELGGRVPVAKDGKIGFLRCVCSSVRMPPLGFEILNRHARSARSLECHVHCLLSEAAYFRPL